MNKKGYCRICLQLVSVHNIEINNFKFNVADYHADKYGNLCNGSNFIIIKITEIEDKNNKLIET
jgi:hypothetical protein